MKNISAFVILLFTQIAWGDDWLPPPVPNQEAATFQLSDTPKVSGWTPDSSPVILPRLQFLEVEGSAKDGLIQNNGTLSLSKLSVADQSDLLKGLTGWINKPLTEDSLERLTEFILQHYEKHDRPMNDVFVPPQDGANGHLRIEVIEGKVGRLGLSKTNLFNHQLLQKGLHLSEGDLLRSSTIQRDLDWLSRNPFRKANLLVSPGEGVSADLLLEIQETRPWRLFAGYDNSGTESVGQNRWFAGFNWGNAFGQDHLLNYRFTRGDSLDDFSAHSLAWEIPLHSQQRWIQLTAARADVSARDSRAGQLIRADGTSWQAGLDYGMLLPRFHGWRHQARFGMEFKRADNFVLFGQNIIPETSVDLFQLRAHWSGRGPLWDGQASAFASLVFSPGGIGGHNSRDDFAPFRNDSDPTYLYARIGGQWQRPLPKDWTLKLRGSAQLASGALIPTEQLDLGGHDTIRGYDERLLLADSGYTFSAEIHTPSFTHKNSSLHALAFLDHGLGWREGEGTESLTSLGLGIRLQLQNTATLRLDLGQALTSPNELTVHGGFFISF